MRGCADFGEKRAAVFLDKDGTLVRDVPYNVDPARVELADGAGLALASLREAGFLVIVVSNQSGVARGFFSEDDVARVADALGDMLRREGGALDGFYYCPHLPEGPVEGYATACECRKPRPGLLRDAADDLGIDLARSWMVGDILDDVEAGNRAGCRTVLLDAGHETEWVPGPYRSPDHTVRSLLDAAALILQRRRETAGAPAREVRG